MQVVLNLTPGANRLLISFTPKWAEKLENLQEAALNARGTKV
ncbi:hypothetical protein [Rhizobium binae]|nr:hypothetical protein [Rhizobium binae]